MLDAIGRHSVIARASGALGTARKATLRCSVAGDVFAFADGDSIGIVFEVGGAKKSVPAALTELRARPMPGYARAVVQFYPPADRKRRWYLDDELAEDDGWTECESLGDLIATLHERRRAS